MIFSIIRSNIYWYSINDIIHEIEKQGNINFKWDIKYCK